MDTYEIQFEPSKARKYRFTHALLFAGMFFLLRFGWTFMSPADAEKNRGLASVAVEIVVVSFIFGLLMAYRPYRLPKVGYKLLVDENSMTGVCQTKTWLKTITTRRTVRLAKVRTVFEIREAGGRPGGIGISERTLLGARILGCVYIPKSLPEFAQLRTLAESRRSVN